jgi:hypothetical protein
MENPASKHTEIPSFTAFFRNPEASDRSPRRRTKNKKAAPNIVGQLRKCALEPRVAAAKIAIDETRSRGRNTLMPRPIYQPSQRASQKRQYQQNATCNLYTDNLLQSERQSKPQVSRPLRRLSRLGFWGRGRQTLPSSKFLMRGPLVRRARVSGKFQTIETVSGSISIRKS